MSVTITTTNNIIVTRLDDPSAGNIIISPYSAPGPNTIGGYEIQVANPEMDDVLQFDTSTWRNRPQSRITDGGNF